MMDSRHKLFLPTRTIKKALSWHYQCDLQRRAIEIAFCLLRSIQKQIVTDLETWIQPEVVTKLGKVLAPVSLWESTNLGFVESRKWSVQCFCAKAF